MLNKTQSILNNSYLKLLIVWSIALAVLTLTGCGKEEQRFRVNPYHVCPEQPTCVCTYDSEGQSVLSSCSAN